MARPVHGKLWLFFAECEETRKRPESYLALDARHGDVSSSFSPVGDNPMSIPQTSAVVTRAVRVALEQNENKPDIFKPEFLATLFNTTARLYSAPRSSGATDLNAKGWGPDLCPLLLNIVEYNQGLKL